MASKVAVLGALHGNFAIFAKLAKLQTKQQFSFAIICGDLFAENIAASNVTAAESDPDVDMSANAERTADVDTNSEPDDVQKLIDGEINIPLPTYFTIGRHALPPKIVDRLSRNNDEVCPNLFFLGKRSTFKTSEGVRIVTLGGLLNPGIIGASDEDKYTPVHTEQDANVLKGADKADVLITSSWPAGVQNGSQVKLEDGVKEPASEQCVADLVKALRPRYHFCASPDLFYEREPFFFRPSEATPETIPVTRFLSVASPGSATKAKWLYAFNLDPTSSAPTEMPRGATPTPFLSPTHGGKRRLPGSFEGSYRYSNPNRDGYGGHSNGKRRRKDRNPPPQTQCFFCLSNTPSTHLVASLGADAYLTTSKGPVPTASTFEPLLTCPAHILIIPYAHAPTIASIPSSAGDDLERKNSYDEMVKLRQALNEMARGTGKGQLGSVCWEINKQAGVHVHWQWMPVPIDLIQKGLVEAGLKVQAEGDGYGAFEKKEIGDGVDVGGDWFRMWVWKPAEENGKEDTVTSWFLPLDASQRFDLQFGRRVMAKLLNTPQRAHWKDVFQTEEEETKDKDAFQAAFKPWDFTDT